MSEKRKTSEKKKMSEKADRLGVSYKTVQRAVADLKKIGAVERIGGRKKGHWKILRND